MPSPQFLRIEDELYDECARRNKKEKYIAPKDNETHDETRKRRRTVRESIETEEETKLRLASDALRKKRQRAKKNKATASSSSKKDEREKCRRGVNKRAKTSPPNDSSPSLSPDTDVAAVDHGQSSIVAKGSWVQVMCGGTLFRAKILEHQRIENQDKCLVHYDGSKKSSKGAVPLDRIEVVNLPFISNWIQNEDPNKIDEFGFVEVSELLSSSIVGEICEEAVKKEKYNRKVETISNALQLNLSEKLCQQVQTEVKQSRLAHVAMATVFGGDNSKSFNGFIVTTPKLLITKPGSYPQLPHADDHCSTCLFCIIHLKDNQDPTRVAKYEGKTKDYPTGITVVCDECSCEEQLPDQDFRRGVHLTKEPWYCGHCSSADSGSHVPLDFEGKVTKAFGELLEEGAPDLCNAYAGGKSQRAGDGFLGLPMLVHRGPGNPTSATESRYTLFFTLQPTYNNVKEGLVGGDLKKYNPDNQIHASYVLYNQIKKVTSTNHESLIQKVTSTYESRPGCSIKGYLKEWHSPLQDGEKHAPQSKKKQNQSSR